MTTSSYTPTPIPVGFDPRWVPAVDLINHYKFTNDQLAGLYRVSTGRIIQKLNRLRMQYPNLLIKRTNNVCNVLSEAEKRELRPVLKRRSLREQVMEKMGHTGKKLGLKDQLRVNLAIVNAGSEG